jgi:hypothetical protein
MTQAVSLRISATLVIRWLCHRITRIGNGKYLGSVSLILLGFPNDQAVH